MIELTIDLSNNPYTVYLEEHLLNHFSSYLSSLDHMVIVTDSGIPLEYIDCVKNQLNNPTVFTIPSGESSKNLTNYQAIIEEMISLNIPKTATIIALGGGVVGDLAGFIASTYMRGIDFIQIPTTLLAQIDSSVGGKVAVNSRQAKNAIGSFYQPKAVFIDPSVLQTLEERQLNSGLGEMLKYGLIADPSILTMLEAQNWTDHLISLIEHSISVKRSLVLEDEFDQGIRHILNYGHTLGHAIEQYSNYQYLHGEAVAIGMAYMAKKKAFSPRLKTLLKKFNLPIDLPYSIDELIPYIVKDKKIHKDVLHFVEVDAIGKAKIVPIALESISTYLKEVV